MSLQFAQTKITLISSETQTYYNTGIKTTRLYVDATILLNLLSKNYEHYFIVKYLQLVTYLYLIVITRIL